MISWKSVLDDLIKYWIGPFAALFGIWLGSILERRRSSEQALEQEQSDWRKSRSDVYQAFLRWLRTVPFQMYKAARLAQPLEMTLEMKIEFEALVAGLNIYSTDQVVRAVDAVEQAIRAARDELRPLLQKANEGNYKLEPALFLETYKRHTDAAYLDVIKAMRAEMTPRPLPSRQMVFSRWGKR